MLTLLTLTVWSISLSGASVSKIMARKTAEAFFEKKTGTRTALSLEEHIPLTRNSSSTSSPLYIFNNGDKAFAIIAGDDRFPPIIGYGLDGCLDEENIPENLETWLEMWEQIILYGAFPKTSSESAERGIDLPEALSYETALWDQGSPYNGLCPVYNGLRSMTGCTATATCIIMRYHSWPEKGEGNLPSYTFESDGGSMRSVQGFPLGDTYKWDSMPLKYDYYSTDEQKTAVAKVMYDVGVMIKSNYDPDGTGSHPYYVREGLVQHMGYDASMVLAERSYTVDDNAWSAKIKKSLYECGPVLYAGYSKNNEGHAFVVDGYDTENKFHINWGWSGSGNGWFTMPSFNEFTEDQCALLNIRKNSGGRAPLDIRLYGTLETASTSFATGEEFSVDFKVGNYGSSTFHGQISVAKFDKDYGFEEVVGEKDSLDAIPGYVYSFTDKCLIHTEIKRGDRVAAVYSTDNGATWTLLPFQRDTNGVIVLEDLTTLAETTSLDYDSDSMTLSISTKKGASLSIQSSSGENVNVASAVSDDGTKYTVDVSLLSKDTYTATIMKGGDKLVFTLVMGV